MACIESMERGGDLGRGRRNSYLKSACRCRTAHCLRCAAVAEHLSLIALLIASVMTRFQRIERIFRVHAVASRAAANGHISALLGGPLWRRWDGVRNRP
eukprot:4518178-Prymnesium_polylepis.1